MFSNNTLINNMFSICECLDSVSCVKEAITQDAYKEFYWRMHFVDDWEADGDEEWEKYILDIKVVVDNTTATHQSKFSIVEDGSNKI